MPAGFHKHASSVAPSRPKSSRPIGPRLKDCKSSTKNPSEGDHVLITKRAAILARFGATDQHTATPVDADRLRAAPRCRRDRDLMAARLQPFDGRGRHAPLDHSGITLKEGAWRVDRALNIHAVVVEIEHHLHVAHWLIVRTHHAEGNVAATIAQR